MSEAPDLDEEAVRLTAYFLWEQDGRPDGREREYWLRALRKHHRERTCDGELRRAPPPVASKRQ